MTMQQYKTESTNSNALDLSQVRIPQDLIGFRSSDGQHVLLLNPHLGSYTRVDPATADCLGHALRAGSNLNVALKEIHLDALRKLILRRIVYYGEYDARIELPVNPIPQILYWETTHGCTLRCDYCYMSADTALPNELGTDEALDMIRQAAELGMQRIVFTGGEAMMRRDLLQLAAFAKSQGLETEIITNATLIDSPEDALALSHVIDHVITSLDGADSQHNDVHRGLGSFDRIVKGIKNLNAIGIKPLLNSTISALNVNGVSELIKFTKESIQISKLRLINVAMLGRGHDGTVPYEWDTYAATHEAMINEPGVVDHVRPQEVRKSVSLRRNCGMGSGEIYIDAKGDLFPCKLVTTPEWRAGNIRETSLTELVQRSPIAKAREMRVEDRVGCRTCMIRRLCGGGCRGMHSGGSGSAETNDPQFCWVLRHQMVSTLWTAEGLAHILSDDAAFVPIELSTQRVWVPELGSALPDKVLLPVIRHLETLAANELPMA
jgi:radical SAM protein with 4Fe4S-binding SPASM domain